MTITWGQFVWAAGLFLLWNGFLVGIIKILISREVKGFEKRLEAAEKKATEADQGNVETKQAIDAATAAWKQALTEALGTLRLEFTNKAICGNHARMEGNDKELFQTIRQLHGDVRELLGGVKALTNSVELLNTHHLNGGR